MLLFLNHNIKFFKELLFVCCFSFGGGGGCSFDQKKINFSTCS